MFMILDIQVIKDFFLFSLSDIGVSVLVVEFLF